MKTITILCLLISLSIPPAVFASENIWFIFKENPSRENFERCSDQVKMSIDGDFAPGQSPTYLTLMKPVTFAPLLNLIEKGNVYAIKLGFQLIPIALENASVSEELFAFLGKSIKTEPELFLILLKSYKTNSPQIAVQLLLSIEEGMIEEWDLELREINLRISALKHVQNVRVKNIKKYSIDVLEKHKKQILELRNTGESNG